MLNKNANVMIQPMGNDIMIFNMNIKKVCVLNESGKEIFNLIDEHPSVGEIVEVLENRYEITGEELHDDVLAIINDLKQADIVTED